MIKMHCDTVDRFEAFEETFLSFCPEATVFPNRSPNRSNEKFEWKGQLSSRGGCSLWQMQSSRAWTTVFRNGHKHLSVVFPLVGAVEAEIRNRIVSFEPGTAFLAAETDIPRMRRENGSKHEHVTFHWSLAEADRVLSSVFPDTTLSEIELRPKIDLTNASGHFFYQLADMVAAGVRDGNHISPQSMALLSEAALRQAFELGLPQMMERYARHRQHIVPRHIKRAVDYMHANLCNPVRMSDVAITCGTSIRAIELGFKSFINATPAAHLRQLRLKAARTELLDLHNPAGVTEIARKYGFANGSRFSALYRAVYGELPSETVQRK